jgi:hypothetical protein
MIIVKSGYGLQVEKWIKLCFQKGGAGDERELGLRVEGRMGRGAKETDQRLEIRGRMRGLK